MALSHVFLPLVFLLVLSSPIISSEANEFLVGGASGGWKIPSPPSEPLNRWAEANRFQVGDLLVWKYDAQKDSVLQVRQKDYLSCNTSSPISEHRDGDTRLRLRRSGPYYFVSGAVGACQKGEKLLVVVMSQRHRFPAGGSLSPAPSPSELDGGSPAMAPLTGGASRAGGWFASGVVLAVGAAVFGLLVL
ncbi:Early nodulin-like protein 1 [Apostasia shenzhenica]|uniref:Early nodulin-like protein 1 n=1 Tax=Apostasia shenzhenica TaxID=1088818 RepID=A0A2I0APY2_9ASPA|nr:Early nodulin-like protein 1 [Apostasia shenzhenica]